MRLLIKLPYAWQLHGGRAVGRLLEGVAGYRRHIAEVNIGLCFPHRSKHQQKQLVRAHFAALGMGLFETAMAWWGADDKVAPLAEVSGMAHLEHALAQGNGVILLTGHFVHLELGARFIALQQPFHALYRPHRNPLYDKLVYQNRQRRAGLPPIPREDVRGLVRGLKRGHAIWYAPDQNYGPKHSLWVPFCGVPALTVTATSRLARLSGAAVIPYFAERLSGTAGYRVTILPPLEGFPSADMAADALRINGLIESWIRRAPEQYLWIHRRFKTGSAEFANVYHRGH